MKRGLWFAAAAGAAYWASRQPGGISGTWRRLQQGVRDIGAGQDPRAVGKRFLSGRDEEPALGYEEPAVAEPAVTGVQQPYRDMVSG
jgi:hypothetical protein